MTARIRTLFTLFAVSGFCGLIYESIWSHYLKLFLGHAAYAQTVVLIVFIGGLALGSWLAGHYAARIARPLLAYAAAEFVVGIAALFFHRFFVASTSWAYDTLLPAACSADSWCWAQWAFAALLIAPQSILLGTTFPFMTGGVLRLDASLAGSKISLLYFLNSLGAAAGVLASGYVLIPMVGLPGVLFTAGTLNVLVAIAAYLADKNTDPAARLQPVEAPREWVATPKATKVLLAVALLTGLSSFIYEIAWIRSLALVLGSTTHAFELMLASFILGLALGGFWIRKRIDGIGDTLRFLAIVQVAMGVLAVLTLPVYDASFDAMAWLLGALQRSDGGWILFNLSSVVICLAVMLPATFMAGMTLPLITVALLRTSLGERSIGHVYAANTAGCILGVFVAVHIGLPMLGLKGLLVLGGAIDVALGVFLLTRAPTAVPRMRAAWTVGGTALLLVAALFFKLDSMKLAAGVYNYGFAALPDRFEVLSHRDGKTASVDVFLDKSKGHVSIATNGKVDGAIAVRRTNDGPGSDEYTMTLLAALPLAHLPEAKTVAVIGFGTGMSTATLLGARGIERVDTVEIEPAMVEGARLFGAVTRAAFEDPRSHIVIDDAKSYFARSGRKYDVIVSEPSNPWVSGVSGLFTKEFYARARAQLNERGILVQWLHTYSFSDGLMASVIRAMRESFTDMAVYGSTVGDLVVVASASGRLPPLRDDVLRMEGLGPLLARIEIRRLEDLALRAVADDRLAMMMFRLADAPPNSDYFPIVDTHAAKLNFLDARASQLAEVAAAPWPILEMMHSLPAPAYPMTDVRWTATQRVREARFAERTRAFLTAPALTDSSGLEGYRHSATLFRLRFIDCQASVDPREWRDAMIATAGLVSVYLSPEASGEVWKRVEGARCFSALDKQTRDWIALFKALGQRDAATSAAIAKGLLAADPNPALADLEYLYGAAMTSLISLGRTEEARELFVVWHRRLPPARQAVGWFRWMRSAIAG